MQRSHDLPKKTMCPLVELVETKEKFCLNREAGTLFPWFRQAQPAGS